MINIAKLKNVVQKDGKIEAQCPACASAGADSKGNHLVVFADGKFACVACPDDKEHRKLIYKLVGEKVRAVSPEIGIRRLVIPESTVLMKLGQLGRKKPTPESSRDPLHEVAADVEEAPPVPAVVENSRPFCPSEFPVEDSDDPY